MSVLNFLDARAQFLQIFNGSVDEFDDDGVGARRAFVDIVPRHATVIALTSSRNAPA